MTAAALLEEVRLLGVDVYIAGDRLGLRPAYRLSPEMVETLRERKPELLVALRSEEEIDADRIGPWRAPGAVTRHCRSCGAGLQPSDVAAEPCFTCRWPGASRRVH